MELTIEKISAVTLRVADVVKSVQFYRDVLGMVLYGGEDAQKTHNLRSSI